MTFRELVQHVSTQASEALAHQRFRGEDLQRELRRRGAAEEPSGVVVNVVSFDGQIRFGGLRGTVHQLSSGPVHDLSIEFFGGSDGTGCPDVLRPPPGAARRATSLPRTRDRLRRFLDTLAQAEGAPLQVGQIEI